MNDRWKRGTFPFKTLFHLSRYHFRFPRYRRAKQRVIFNRSLFLSLSLIRTSRSHLLSLTYLKLQTSDRRDSRKNVVRASKIYRSIDGATIHIFCTIVKHHGHFESLYLGNGSRYRDEWKTDFNGMVSSIFWVHFDDKIVNSFRAFRAKSWRYICDYIKYIRSIN